MKGIYLLIIIMNLMNFFIKEAITYIFNLFFLNFNSKHYQLLLMILLKYFFKEKFNVNYILLKEYLFKDYNYYYQMLEN